MKALLLLLAGLLALPSCTFGPTVARTPKGGYLATAGGTLAARRQNVLAEVVTREGDTIRFSTTDEDSTSVPNTYIGWKGAEKLAKIRQPVELKGTKDPNVIPKDPNVIPKDPNVIPFDPNVAE